MPVAIGVMAYNEERNIGRLLESVLAQRAAERVTRIIVVASGCTDGTCDVVERFMERDKRIELISEGERAGKIAAINTFLDVVTEPFVLISCGDLIFEPDSLDALIGPLAEPGVGMTGAHPIPLNDKTTFAGYAVHLMWDLHHRIASEHPKMGELVAFRNIFRRLETRALCDELSIEKKIRDAGLSIVYAPDARISNKGPETIGQFIRQRIRWNAANLQIISDHAMEVSTMSPGRILKAAAEIFREPGAKRSWIVAIAAIEAYCRVRAYLDYFVFKSHLKHRVWQPLDTTKNLEIE